MKVFFTIALVFSALCTFGQSPLTETLIVKGIVEKEVSIGFADIRKHTEVELGDLIIYNHNGELVKTVHQAKGVSLKDVLSEVVISTSNPRDLVAYYLLCTASDGYAITGSWKEIFHAKDVFVLTEVEGIELEDYGKSIQLFHTRDLQSGRRFMRGVSVFEVKKG